MRNFLYSAGIFLLLLSPATCNYDENGLLNSGLEEKIGEDLPGNTEEVIEEVDATIPLDEGDPIIKPRKP